MSLDDKIIFLDYNINQMSMLIVDFFQTGKRFFNTSTLYNNNINQHCLKWIQLFSDENSAISQFLTKLKQYLMFPKCNLKIYRTVPRIDCKK